MFGDGAKTGGAEGVGEVGEGYDQLVAFAGGSEAVETLVAVVVELFGEGGCGFAGEGVEEASYGCEFIGFVVVDVLDGMGFGKDVEEDEELFF